MISADKRGVEGYPMQLMIIVIVLGVTLPIVFSSFDYYKKSQTRALIEMEVSRLEDSIVQTYNMGHGGVLIIDIELPGYTHYLRIGGPLDDLESRYIIEFRVEGMDSHDDTINDGARSIPVTSNLGHTLTLAEGKARLRIEKKISDQDWDPTLEGGLEEGDYYIEVKRVF